MQGPDGAHGSRLPFQARPRHPVWIQEPIEEGRIYKDGFIGMLESGMEKQDVPEVLPCFHPTSDKGSILKVQIEGDNMFLDDLTGQLLDPELVKAARNKEMEYFDSKDVWVLRPIDECRRVMARRR